MKTTKENIYQKQQKVLLIPVTNTIINPRTVMIHPCNALLAGGAVMTHWDLYLVTFLAHPLEDGFNMHYLLYTEVIVIFY
jgi:hypothetical protein